MRGRPNSKILSISDSILDLWDASDKFRPGYPDTVVAGYAEASIGSPVAWSPEGHSIAASGSGTIDIWNPDTSGLSHYESGHQSYALAWSPDGAYLAASSATTLEVWDTNNKRRLTQMKSGSLADPIRLIAWSPKLESEKIATAGSRQIGVQIWKLVHNRLQLETNFPGATSVAWAPDGSKMILCRNKALEIWQSSL